VKLGGEILKLQNPKPQRNVKHETEGSAGLASVRASGSEKKPGLTQSRRIVAILLRTGLKGANVVEIGKTVGPALWFVDAFGQASWEELANEPGIGRTRRDARGAFCAGSQARRREVWGIPDADTPDCGHLMREEARLRGAEVLQRCYTQYPAAIDWQGVKIAMAHSIQSSCTRREVFQSASPPARRRSFGAQSSSGDPTPSKPTSNDPRPDSGGQLLKIEVLDHVIMAARPRNG